MVRLYYPDAPIQWSWLVVGGPDARDFLQRLSTVDLRRIEAGVGAPGCLLTAQGKLRGLFHLWSYGDEFGLEFDAGADGFWRRSILEFIEQYTFSEKLAVTPAEGLACAWLFPESHEDLSGLFDAEALARGGSSLFQGLFNTQVLEDEIRLCDHGSAQFGRRWLTAWGRPERLRQWLDRGWGSAPALRFEELERWRIEAIRPRVGAEIDADTLPLEVGLADSVAANKGCYPGQEVIERVLAHGSPARRLVRLATDGPAPAAGTKILNLAEPPAEVGMVTSAVGEMALALVRKLHAKEGLELRFAGDSVQGKVTGVAPYAE